MADEMTPEQWLAIRKEAGLKIDPATAEVTWTYIQIADPYGIDPDLPEECQCVGRGYFACAPDSEVWVSFYDLPEVTRDALWEKHKHELAFPAGLPLELLEENALRQDAHARNVAKQETLPMNDTPNMQEAFNLGMELMKIAEPHVSAVAIIALSGALAQIVRSVYPQDRRAQAFRRLCTMMIDNYENGYARRLPAEDDPQRTGSSRAAGEAR